MNERISYLSKLLNIPEETISLVLYTYMAETLKQCVNTGSARSIFGTLKLDEDNNLQLIPDSNTDMFEKSDIEAILHLIIHGPNKSIFS